MANIETLQLDATQPLTEAGPDPVQAQNYRYERAKAHAERVKAQAGVLGRRAMSGARTVWEDPRTQAVKESTQRVATEQARTAGRNFKEEYTSGSGRFMWEKAAAHAAATVANPAWGAKRATKVALGKEATTLKGAAKTVGKQFGKEAAIRGGQAAWSAHRSMGAEQPASVSAPAPAAWESPDTRDIWGEPEPYMPELPIIDPTAPDF